MSPHPYERRMSSSPAPGAHPLSSNPPSSIPGSQMLMSNGTQSDVQYQAHPGPSGVPGSVPMKYPPGPIPPPFPAPTTESIQKMLDDNYLMIMAVRQTQNTPGREGECQNWQAKLQRQLVYLATLAESLIKNHKSLQQATAIATSSANTAFMQRAAKMRAKAAEGHANALTAGNGTQLTAPQMNPRYGVNQMNSSMNPPMQSQQMNPSMMRQPPTQPPSQPNQPYFPQSQNGSSPYYQNSTPSYVHSTNQPQPGAIPPAGNSPFSVKLPQTAQPKSAPPVVQSPAPITAPPPTPPPTTPTSTSPKKKLSKRARELEEKEKEKEREKEKPNKKKRKQEKEKEKEREKREKKEKKESEKARKEKEKMLKQQEKQKKEKGSRTWTPEENNKFLEALKKFGSKDIKEIANYVGTRSLGQVRTHLQKHLKSDSNGTSPQSLPPSNIALPPPPPPLSTTPTSTVISASPHLPPSISFPSSSMYDAPPYQHTSLHDDPTLSIDNSNELFEDTDISGYTSPTEFLI